MVGFLTGAAEIVGWFEGNDVGSVVVLGGWLGCGESSEVGVIEIDGFELCEGWSDPKEVGPPLLVGFSLGSEESADDGVVVGDTDTEGIIVWRFSIEKESSIYGSNSD